MIEVEIKLPVENRQELERKLQMKGFQAGKCVKEEDIYFNSPERDLKKRDEALRIRTVTNLETESEESVLTYKGPKLDHVSMTRKELETGVENPQMMREIFCALGYEKQYMVRKKRSYYEKEKLTACVDQVEGLGNFLELEILLTDENKREEALAEIEKLLHELGYQMSETSRTSYLSMLMKETDE